jgi:hypothetical protein
MRRFAGAMYARVHTGEFAALPDGETLDLTGYALGNKATDPTLGRRYVVLERKVLAIGCFPQRNIG